MLSGKFEHQVDDKLRFRIPPKFKAEIGPNPFIMIGKDDKCVYIFEHNAGEEILKSRFQNVDIFSEDGDDTALKKMRHYFSNGDFYEEDKQGRIALKPKIAEKIKIKKNIVTIGAFNHLELWAEEEWDAYDC